MDKNGIFRLNFASDKPIIEFVEKETRKSSWVNWGEKNDYPDFLQTLYDSSAYHNSLISGKSDYISGKGWSVDRLGLDTQGVAEMERWIESPNEDETLNDILESVAWDYEVFEGFMLEIIWDKRQKFPAEIRYADLSKYRIDKEKTGVWFSNDWSKSRQNEKDTGLEFIPFFDTENPKGKQIAYFRKMRGSKYYPKPNYIGSIRSIATDAEISNYDYNTLVNGFMAGTLVSFNDGEPEETEKKAIEKKLKEKHGGTDNANSVVLVFSNSQDTAPTVLHLTGNDLDKRYDQLDKRNQQKIFTGHKITSPMLFGIKTEGQLGGRDEILQAELMFKKRYVEKRQRFIEMAFNSILEVSGFKPRLKITPVSNVIDDVKVEMSSNKTKVANIKNFEKFGRAKSECNIVKKLKFVHSKEEVESLEGYFKSEKFAVVSGGLDDMDFNILSLIKKDPLVPASIIASTLNIRVSSTLTRLKNLFALKMLSGAIDGIKNLTKKAENAVEEIEPGVENLEVVYSYEVRPELGPEVIPTTRDFCRELIGLDKVYTREEIEQISALEGRDVWRLRGGFYSNPKTDITTPHCRHIWESQLVERNG